MKTCSTALGVGERDGLFGDGFCVVEGWFVGCRGAWYGRVRRESGWEECARAGAGAVAGAGAGSAADAGAALDSGAGATEALPRARARYAVAPVLLAPRIFYMLHIIDIVIMFCYDAKKLSLIWMQVLYVVLERFEGFLWFNERSYQSLKNKDEL